MPRETRIPPEDSLGRVVIILLSLLAQSALADGAVVDKVYHPYVDALESEIEFRTLVQDPREGVANDRSIVQLSFGQALGSRFFAEAYVVGSEKRLDGFDLEAYELELKWQLTEQGEFAADWGLLFEWEDELDQDVHEFTATLLVEKEFGRFSANANLGLINEWGHDIEDEIETAFAAQSRYRYSRAFEPAIEFYAGQDYRGLGPVALGRVNLGIRKNLSWEAGLIFGIDKDSPAQTIRILLEFEF